MGIQTGTIKGGVIENARLTGLNKEFEVKVDKAFIQKAIMDEALSLMNQIDVNDIEDLDLTTTQIEDCFRIELSVDIKRP
ncbi:hypothetical protein OEZ17_17525 [Enterococcus avium]|uniref:hypothetical protein n=1 Tax=Enterococcus avium TaxID=33945 RepID=UPI0025AF3C93|nr:hypothetical protein [Enterococcus avium]MDN2639304.1 hypothetical protein [Enterococcus avium]